MFLLAQRTEPRTRFREGRLQFGVDGLAEGLADPARADSTLTAFLRQGCHYRNGVLVLGRYRR